VPTGDAGGGVHGRLATPRHVHGEQLAWLGRWRRGRSPPRSWRQGRGGRGDGGVGLSVIRTWAAAGADFGRRRGGRFERGAGLVEWGTRVAAGANDQRLRGPLGRRVLGVRGRRRASKARPAVPAVAVEGAGSRRRGRRWGPVPHGTSGVFTTSNSPNVVRARRCSACATQRECQFQSLTGGRRIGE